MTFWGRNPPQNQQKSTVKILSPLYPISAYCRRRSIVWIGSNLKTVPEDWLNLSQFLNWLLSRWNPEGYRCRSSCSNGLFFSYSRKPEHCFRPRPKSDFYTCKIREWIFEGLPFGSLGYLRETSRAREELILFLKTMQIFKIISVERKGLPFFGKHYSGGVMLRNGKVSRAIGRYIGSWKYDKSWHLGG